MDNNYGNSEAALKTYSGKGVAKFFIYTIIGILIFFVTASINGEKTILLTHLIHFIEKLISPIIHYLLVLVTFVAVVDLFRNFKKHTETVAGKVFSVVRIFGFLFVVMAVLNVGPAILTEERIFPFIVERILTTMLIAVPISSIFLPMLLSAGCVETVGLILRPVMRPLFKVPGRSAVIAITAFFSSNAVGILAIDKMYKEGKFTAREAALLATGFCTQAIAFLIIIAGVTGLMPVWNFYFFGTFLILMIVAMITGRIWPLCKIPNTCFEKCDYQEEEVVKSGLLKKAFVEGFIAAENMGSMTEKMISILKTSLYILTIIIGSGMVFATIGLLLFYHTPVFQWIGFIFYPFAALMQIPDLHLVSGGAAAGLVDPMTPAILGSQTQSFVAKFVLATLPVTSIIGFGLTIPVYISTSIPLKFWQMMVVWIERVIISIITAAIIAMIFSKFFM